MSVEVEIGVNPGVIGHSHPCADGDGTSLIADGSKSSSNLETPTPSTACPSFLVQGRIATALSALGLRFAANLGGSKLWFRLRQLTVTTMSYIGFCFTCYLAAGAESRASALFVAGIAGLVWCEATITVLGVRCLCPDGGFEAMVGNVPSDQEEGVSKRRNMYVRRMTRLFVCVAAGSLGASISLVGQGAQPVFTYIGLTPPVAIIVHLFFLIIYLCVVAAAGCTCLALALVLAAFNAQVDSVGAALASRLAATAATLESQQAAFSVALERHMAIRRAAAVLGASTKWAAVVAVTLLSCVLAFLSSVVGIVLAGRKELLVGFQNSPLMWIMAVSNVVYSEWALVCGLMIALEAARLNDASRRMAQMLSEGCYGDRIERAAFRADIKEAPVQFAVVGGSLVLDKSFVTSCCVSVFLALGSFLGGVVQHSIS